MIVAQYLLICLIEKCTGPFVVGKQPLAFVAQHLVRARA